MEKLLENSGRIIVILSIALIALVVSSCATLSKDECLQANWELIGYGDGTRGYPSSRLDSHRKDCAKHGITPTLAAYNKGRDRGLAEFCKPSRGYSLGLGGGSYAQVCPPNLEWDFLNAYNYGSKINQATLEVKGQQKDLRRSLANYEQIIVSIENAEADLISATGSALQRVAILGRLKELHTDRDKASIAIDDSVDKVDYAKQTLRNLYGQNSYSKAAMPTFSIIEIVKRKPSKVTVLDSVIENKRREQAKREQDDHRHDNQRENQHNNSTRPYYSFTKAATKIVREHYQSHCQNHRGNNPSKLKRAINEEFKNSKFSKFRCHSIETKGTICHNNSKASNRNNTPFTTVVSCSASIGSARVPFGITVGCGEKNGQTQCRFRDEPNLARITRNDLPKRKNRDAHITTSQCFKHKRGVGLTLREGDNFSDCMGKAVIRTPTPRGCQLVAKTTDNNPILADMCYWQLAVKKRDLNICDQIVWRNSHRACRNGKHP